MKKSYPFLISLLGIFFLLPFISFSNALPPDYIGVQVGEEYTWTFSMNPTTIAQFGADTGQNITMSGFESMTSIQFKGAVSWISDEIFNASYSYVIVNLTIYMNVPGMGWIEYPEPGAAEPLPVFVLSNETSNYFNETINAMNLVTLEPPISFALPFIIVPHNLNWTDAIQGLSGLLIGITGGMTGATIEVWGNGFKMTVPEQLVNGSLVRQTEYIAQWNDKGVFAQGKILYGGATMMAINAAEGEIPGYEITILIGVFGVSTLGLVYYKKKKK
ncbi:MAG: hypothetical protein ACFFCY_01835 [Promethearchaeota archaeon]